MEYRKLISFGKSSFVVSLPKSWINQNKMKKGDLIYLEENGQNLLLSKSDAKKEEENKTKIINVDGKDMALIAREVNSAYILNYRTIILKGKEIKDRIKEIQEIFQYLIALEVMEQGTNNIIAKDFLNMEQVSIEELIRKMDIITRTMIKESIESVSVDNYENINDRDKDVNRLYFLVYRTVLYNLEHLSNALKRLKMGPCDLLHSHFIAFYLEGIADETRRTARFARNIKNLKDKTNVTNFLHKIEQYYLDTLKAYYDRDIESALKISSLKTDYNKELDLIEGKSNDFGVLNVASRIRRMISYIHSLGRVIYTGSNY
ncbi:MAG: phosphate uptake regulator PhoU [Candidatus Woesearchaeota archaeon]